MDLPDLQFKKDTMDWLSLPEFLHAHNYTWGAINMKVICLAAALVNLHSLAIHLEMYFSKRLRDCH
jgi:hypothetical protein